MTGLVSDVRYALRWLRRSPGFAATAILSLGLGIGFNTAIFSVVDALILRPLPVSEPDRLVDLFTSGADGDTYSTSSLPDLEDYRVHVAVFEDVIGYSPMFGAVARNDRTRLTLGEVVTANYFQVLGMKARVGRTLLPGDGVPGAPRSVVLSAAYWRREFAGDERAIGQLLRIRGQAFTIVGVLEPTFTGMVPMLAPEIWVPVRYVEDVEPAGINEAVPSPTGTSRLDRRGQRWLFAKARLRPGHTLAEARANVATVASQLGRSYPETNKDRRVTVLATSATRVHPDADGLMALIAGGTMGAVGLLLLIACANVAGMLLARASMRQREIGIRLALGAGRRRLMQQMVTESLTLAGFGALAGVLLAAWLTRALSTFDLPLPIALSLDLRLDARTLAFTLLATVITGVVAGLAPALQSTRRGLVARLKGDAGVSDWLGGRRWNARDLLVVSQVATTTLLLVVAGLMGRSLIRSIRAEAGFRTSGLAIVSADLNALRYTPERSRAYWDEAARRIRALPGVEGVALASRAPFSLNFNRNNIAVPGYQRSPDEMGASINSAIVSPGYFATLGISVIQGRAFRESDTATHQSMVVISETMARKYWPAGNSVGQIVYERRLDSGRPLEIIGVVADHKLQTVGEAPQAAIFFSTTQRPSAYNVIVARTRGDERALVGDIRRVLLAIEPSLLVMEQQTMRQQIAATLFPVRVAGTLVGVFSGIGLLLAAIGLYGVVAFNVARRTREIGIRMAIGARPRSVVALVVRQGMLLVGVGLAAGALLAGLASRVMAGWLYGVSAADPIAWSGAALAVLVVGGLAHLVPARRALGTNPVTALRSE